MTGKLIKKFIYEIWENLSHKIDSNIEVSIYCRFCHENMRLNFVLRHNLIITIWIFTPFVGWNPDLNDAEYVDNQPCASFPPKFGTFKSGFATASGLKIHIKYYTLSMNSP